MLVIETISLLCPLAIMLEENFGIAEKHSFEFLLNKNIIKAPSREYCQGSQQTTKLKGKTDSKAVSCCSRGIKRELGSFWSRIVQGHKSTQNTILHICT